MFGFPKKEKKKRSNISTNDVNRKKSFPNESFTRNNNNPFNALLTHSFYSFSVCVNNEEHPSAAARVFMTTAADASNSDCFICCVRLYESSSFRGCAETAHYRCECTLQ